MIKYSRNSILFQIRSASECCLPALLKEAPSPKEIASHAYDSSGKSAQSELARTFTEEQAKEWKILAQKSVGANDSRYLSIQITQTIQQIELLDSQ